MVNFVLFHKGPLPGYLSTCINQIKLTQVKHNIYVLIEEKYINTLNIDKITEVPLSSIEVPELQHLAYYTTDRDPLWRTAFERFFYINSFIKKNYISDIVHFDNDVLIYGAVVDILEELKEYIPNIGLTPHKLNELVCGFMYIKNFDSLDVLCSELLRYAKLGERRLEQQFQTMPHEMRLLGEIHNKRPDIITELPVSPIAPGSNLFKKFKIVFDPSTYGQYIGGTHSGGGTDKKIVHSCNRERYIDRHIGDLFEPYFDFKNKVPFLRVYKELIPIFNLHIHSKQLELYV